jgi:ABC-2 type transport system ATP-binding protein
MDPAPAAASALRCRGLVKRFGTVVAVAGLDLDVRGGECFGMLGPNGAGKTTTVEILEGLTVPDEGEVEVLGERWHGDGLALRGRLGVQLQETKFPDKLQVDEVMTLFRSFYPRGMTTSEALAVVDLQEKSGARVNTLSGGQKQRLSLACALIGDPELLFLDEPTTGLDPQSRRQTWEIVEGMKARGRTVMITTHYMEEAARLCDRVAIVDHGKVIALDTPRALRRLLPGDEGVGLTLAADADPSGVLAPFGEAQVEDAGEGLWHARLYGDVVPGAVIAAAEAAGARLVELRRLEGTLEDVFVHLTGRDLR